MNEKELIVYTDYVCLFCYIGKKSLERYLETRDKELSIDWRFYDLQGYKRGFDGDIDNSDDWKSDEYFEKVKQNVEKLKDRYGIDMKFDELRKKEIDSWNAQKASLYVKEKYDYKIFESFHSWVFEDLWKNGRDIGNIEALKRIAQELARGKEKINPQEISEAIKNEDFEKELKKRFKEGEKAGIQGVPTFIYCEYMVAGAIPPEQFRRLIEGM